MYSYYNISTTILISLILSCSSNITYIRVSLDWKMDWSSGMNYGMDNGMYSWWHNVF